MTQPSPDTGQGAQMAGQQPLYNFGTTVDAPLAVAVTLLTDALRAEGFDILTRIDAQQVLRDRLNVDTEPYLILGTCNPQLAHRALQAEQNVGLAMPCSIVAYEEHLSDGTRNNQRTRIEFSDPIAMMNMIRQPDVQQVAREAQDSLQRVSDNLSKQQTKQAKQAN